MKETRKYARFAVLAAFFINGALMATWVSRIPAIQSKLNLSEGLLGLVLLGISAGVLTALSLVGGFNARFGSPKVTLAGALIMVAVLPFLGLANNAILLTALLFIFGAAMSIMDVAMNEQAVLVERAAQKPLMSSFHSSFSVGGLAGALIGAGMASLPVMVPFLHFLLVALFFAFVMVFVHPRLISVETSAAEDGPVFRLPHRALWALGALAFCCSIGEGSMADWSAVYLTEILQTNAAFAALGFAAYSLTMTAGRFMGDWLTKVRSPKQIVRSGAIIAALGFLIAIVSNSPVLTLIAFALVGLGLANVVPLAFSAAGNHPSIPTSLGIAGVATIGYAGFLAGPPIIGLIAEISSLRFAFIFILLLIVSMIFTSKSISITES